MRKIITIVVASLIPIGMWTAGCRQNNRQAAFPKSSELKGLAKADAPGKNKPPRIEPVIDRDVLNYPESGAVARAAAVDDRSRQLAQPKPADDLFSLPDMGGSMASASYNPKPADIGPAPEPAGREFWSRQTSAPAGHRSGPVPADVSAMAPAANETGFAGAPVQFLPPPPASKPARSSAPSSNAKPGASNGLFMDDIPGVFLEGSPISQRGGPPGSKQSLNALQGGDALGAPPLLTKGGNATRAGNTNPRETFASAASSKRQGPVKLDLSGLLGDKARNDSGAEIIETAHRPALGPASGPAFASLAEPVSVSASPVRSSSRSFDPHDSPPMIVRAIPGDYEPLPEPIPLADYMASLEKTKQEPAAKMSERRRRPNAIQTETPASLGIGKMETSARTSGGFTLPIPAKSALPEARPKTAPQRTAVKAIDAGESGLLPLPPTAKKIAAEPVSLKPVAPVSSLDMKKALAPLPDLSGGTASSEKKVFADKKVESASKKASAPALTLPPPLAAAKAELPGDSPARAMESLLETELPEPKKAPPSRRKRTNSENPVSEPLGISAEIDAMIKKASSAAPLEIPESGPASPLWLDEPPALPALPSASVVPDQEKREPAVKIEPPRRVKLQPVRRARDKELMKIDSEMEVPPMKF